MIESSKVAECLEKHFSELSNDAFVSNVRRFCPELLATDQLPTKPQEVEMTQLILFQAHPSAIPLDAYLACALTGLNSEQRELMFHLSDIVAMVCKEQNIDLYEPRKKTDPVYHPDVSDTEVFRTDRERVLAADLLIHLCHYPSTGAGEELEFANAALVPIILISHSENRVSKMITGIPGFKLKIDYTEPEELRAEMARRLAEIRPILEERKLAFSKYEINLVGDRIRSRREELSLTREEVAKSVPLLTRDVLRQIEESPDHISNPTLLQLRQIAAVLKTTVADLVEPDLGERMITVLEEWITGRAAARFQGIDIKDRDRIIRRILLRVIDSLEGVKRD